MTFLPGFRYKPAAAGAAVARNGVSFDGVDDEITKAWSGKTVTNNKKFTFASWFELPIGTSEVAIFESAGAGGGALYVGMAGSGGYAGLISSGTPFVFLTTDDGGYRAYQKGASSISYGTKYFLMCVFDSAQATESNRLKIWFGPYGGAVTAQTWTDVIGGTIGLNNTFDHGSGTTDTMGTDDGASYYKGRMADTYWLDGQTLADPSNLVDSYASNAKPKAYSGSYGTTGFHLDFSNSGSLGADSSGNGNNFTPAGGPSQITPYL